MKRTISVSDGNTIPQSVTSSAELFSHAVIRNYFKCVRCLCSIGQSQEELGLSVFLEQGQRMGNERA
jgi:hypothetical protein